MVSQGLVQKVIQAVAHVEGFFNGTNDIPVRANNPCDITDDGDIGYGVSGTSKITNYPAVEQGWSEAAIKFERILNGHSKAYPLTLTLEQMGMKYSGDPNWGKNVATRLGLTPETTLQQLVDTDTQWSATS